MVTPRSREISLASIIACVAQPSAMFDTRTPAGGEVFVSSPRVDHLDQGLCAYAYSSHELCVTIGVSLISCFPYQIGGRENCVLVLQRTTQGGQKGSDFSYPARDVSPRTIGWLLARLYAGPATDRRPTPCPARQF